MIYSHILMKMCKPLYKTSVIVFRIGMVFTLVGLLIGIFGKGWITLFIGIGCYVISIILCNIPTYYLVMGFIKVFYKDITSKQAVDIAQKHLREPFINSDDTITFVHDIIGGYEQEKTHHTYRSS